MVKNWCGIMWFFNVLLQLFILSVVAEELNHSLHKKLNKWHTLKSEDLRLQRHRRSVQNENSVLPLDKEVSFEAFDKAFTLSLMPSPDIFAPAFKAYVHSKKESRELHVDKASILTGKVLGDDRSEVTAHLNGKMLTANIVTDNETYFIEPLWRHLSSTPQPQASHSENKQTNHKRSSDMLVYRQSDLNLMHLHNPHSSKGFCDTNDLMAEFRSQPNKEEPVNHSRRQNKPAHDDHRGHHRGKRAAENMKKICKLSLIADHRFYREMGNNSALETMYYLINLIERVNKIYKRTDWGSSTNTPRVYEGYGFQIGKITIHTEPTDTPRYNKDRKWRAKDLLEAFSEVPDLSECLSHLFTFVDFGKGLLGLAYVGSSKVEDVGGICSRPYKGGKGKPTLYLNTGLTSTVNWGQKILTREADLVTAHELGHNFGAEHDDDTAAIGTETRHSCTPGQSHNGNYIMYPAAVSGQYENNDKFSDCSKHNVLPSLQRKAPICFQEDNKSFCGNYQVETHDNETCDVGYLTTEDRCCLPDCTLRKGAKCSNKNYPCCTEDCQAAPRTKLCRASIPNLCYRNTYCDGVHFECPKPDPLPDNTTCGDLGKCQGGHCIQFCYTQNKQPCLCTNKDQYCLRCCAPPGVTGAEMTRLCTPFLNESNGEYRTLGLPENSTCHLGYCSKGICQKHTQDVIERVWNIFQYIAPDKIGQFLADNIVGAVLVFSLLFWIPCSCLVNFVDKKRLKERQKEEKWWSERGADYSRSSGFMGVGGGSAPVTPRIRIQRNNMNWTGVARSGFGAREQWRASQERGIALKKSTEGLDEGPKLSVVSGSPNNSAALSLSHPSLSQIPENEDNERPPLLRSGAISLSKSQPSLASPISPNLSEKSFDGEDKPIAASSNTDLSLKEKPYVETSIVDPGGNFAVFRRPSLRRQEAMVSPQ